MKIITSKELRTILENHKKWVETGGQRGEWANLKGANLKGADLYGANLEGAYLEGAYLEGANLTRTDLQGAILWGTDLRVADLKGADLRGADLWKANLQGADLKKTWLRGANLWEARIDKNTKFPEGFDWKAVGCVMVDDTDANTEESKKKEKEKRNMGTTTTTTKRALSTLAGDCRAAGKRIAVKRGTELARGHLCALLAPEGCNSERRAAVSEFLGTPEGEALLQFVVALSWEGIKGAVPEQYQGTGDEIAEELRVSALATVGGTVLQGIETVLVPFLAQQTKVLAGEGLSALAGAFQPAKVRVEAAPVGTAKVEGAEELQAEAAKLDQLRRAAK